MVKIVRTGSVMDAAEEYRLVHKAMTCGLSNCLEWANANVQRRVINDPDLNGLTPKEIKRLVIDHVCRNGELKQKKENRSEYSITRDFWYQVLIDIDRLPRPLFVEIVLNDDDADCPTESIVSAHLSTLI